MDRLTARAAEDIDEILEYSVTRFGGDVALRYYQSLEACLKSLGENPDMGREAAELMDGLRRFEHESHIVFYQLIHAGILVIRVLHKSRGIPRHFQ